jgi:phosphoglycolate phosphatase-like HAD superfamily hydrolase
MNKKVLFLDFDGVLFDTLKEVYLVNRCLYKGIGLFDEVNKENYALYSKYKYLVYNIWMFYYYNPLLFDGCDNIANEFHNALLNRNIEKENAFCNEFLKIRADLVKNNYDFWKSLETPYDFFFEIKKLYEEIKPEIVVVSKKNKAAIVERFHSYGFNLPEDKVFAREVLDKYSTKGEFMVEYMAQNGFESAVFVDDNNNNLKTCNNYPQIRQILALWGNAQPNLDGYNQEEAFSEIKNYFKSK